MRFTVRELAKARADKRHIFEWLHARSRTGAIAWLSAYDAMVDRLKSNADGCGNAPEAIDIDMIVRQVLFKTRQGRIYRVVFLLDADTASTLRIRGPGQAPGIAIDMEG